MKKQILNIGKALSRAEQKSVFGGMVLDPCVGNYNMDRGCLCDPKNQQNCASGVCNRGEQLGHCA